MPFSSPSLTIDKTGRTSGRFCHNKTFLEGKINSPDERKLAKLEKKQIKKKPGTKLLKIQKVPNIRRYSELFGADGGNRTHNLLITSEMLYH